MKTIKNFNKHLQYFIGISALIFLSAGLAHVCLLIKGSSVSLGGMLLPTYVSYLVIFISTLMFVMAVYYMRALKSKGKVNS